MCGNFSSATRAIYCFWCISHKILFSLQKKKHRHKSINGNAFSTPPIQLLYNKLLLSWNTMMELFHYSNFLFSLFIHKFHGVYYFVWIFHDKFGWYSYGFPFFTKFFSYLNIPFPIFCQPKIMEPTIYF